MQSARSYKQWVVESSRTLYCLFCGNFIGEFQFNLDFTRVSSQSPPGVYCGYFHRCSSGCCVTAEGVFGTFLGLFEFTRLLKSMHMSLLPTLEFFFSVAWGWVCNHVD